MKRIISILVCMMMVLALVPSAVFAAEENYGEAAYSYLEYIDENLTQRRAGGEVETAAAEFIFGELEDFGYEPEYQEFSYTRGWGENVTTTESQNVIAFKDSASDKQIIVGAHYDSVGTHGVDDNGSGTVVLLETAQRMFDEELPYDVVFIFFGAEETGLQGSKAYANAMTEEEIENTICMINMDSILAGTYRYIYSGTVAGGKMTLSWPFYQAMAISDELGLGMVSNDTDLNYDYPSPSTGSWSDHQSFRNKNIPYLYFEAANWELPDDPTHPDWGSSGAYETETGEVMHVAGRDDLTFIENEWGTRGKDTVAAYCELLPEILKTLKPYTLVNAYGEEEAATADADEDVLTVKDTETVTLIIDGPEAEDLGIFDAEGNEIESTAEYADGTWTVKFNIAAKGEYDLSVQFYNGGKWVEAAEWVDTEVDVKLNVVQTPKILGVEDGETYYTDKNVTVEDDDLDTVTVNGEEAEAEFVLANEEAVTYEIVATDKTGNVTTVTVTLKPVAALADELDGLTEDNVKSSDLEAIEDVIATAEELLNEQLTDDEKAALEEVEAKAAELLEKIEEAQNAVATENVDKALDITKEDVKAEDKETLEAAKADLEKALEDYDGNYTEEEKEIIEAEIERLEDMLDLLNNPPTGDDMAVILWASVMMMSVVGIVATRRRAMNK